MGRIVYVDWDGLLYYDDKVKQYIRSYQASTIKFGGNVSSAKLPEPFKEYQNYVYRVTDELDTSMHPDWFYFTGKYPAGTLLQNIALENAEDEVKYAIFNTNGIDKSFEEHLEELQGDVDTINSSISKLDTAVASFDLRIADKQQTLVSGKNISTINGQSLLNGGDITIETEDAVCEITQPVTAIVGGFKPGIKLEGKTYDELFEILLCDSFDPKTPNLIKTHRFGDIPAPYIGSNNSTSYTSYLDATIVQSETDKNIIDPSQTVVYQKAENSLIVETGYQIKLLGLGKGIYSFILIPDIFEIDSIQIYDDLNKDNLDNPWVTYANEFIDTEELLDIAGIHYRKYASSASHNTNAELYFRFILKNREVSNG